MVITFEKIKQDILLERRDMDEIVNEINEIFTRVHTQKDFAMSNFLLRKFVNELHWLKNNLYIIGSILSITKPYEDFLAARKVLVLDLQTAGIDLDTRML